MPRSPFKMSFQLYTARDFPPQEAVLAGLAEIGYQAVEPWLPDYGDDPKGFRKRIDDAGLVCLGFHMPLKGLLDETDRFIDIAHTIGDQPLMIPPISSHTSVRATSTAGRRSASSSAAAPSGSRQAASASPGTITNSSTGCCRTAAGPSTTCLLRQARTSASRWILPGSPAVGLTRSPN